MNAGGLRLWPAPVPARRCPSVLRLPVACTGGRGCYLRGCCGTSCARLVARSVTHRLPWPSRSLTWAHAAASSPSCQTSLPPPTPPAQISRPLRPLPAWSCWRRTPSPQLPVDPLQIAVYSYRPPSPCRALKLTPTSAAPSPVHSPVHAPVHAPLHFPVPLGLPLAAAAKHARRPPHAPAALTNLRLPCHRAHATLYHSPLFSERRA